MPDFTNTAQATGLVDSVSTALTGAVTIRLVEGLTLIKTADKASWANGPLTYTITIDNTDGTESYTDVRITDILDPSIIVLINNSVTINGANSSDYTYDPVTGELVVSDTAPLTVAAGGTAIITFQVQKASPTP
jgi:conserved repeat domain